MEKELLLKTVFSCMACDGDIAQEEIELVKQLVINTNMFDGINVEDSLNSYVEQININGKRFLTQYLNELASDELTKAEQYKIIDLAFQTIDSDNVIEYSEVKFFKKIRSKMSLTDEEILSKHPEKEDFLLPDIYVAEEPEWNDTIFSGIKFNNIESVN